MLTKEFFFMISEISAKYFSTKFIIDNKLKLTDIVILEYIYSWILSERPPECRPEMGKKCFYLSQTHIANDFEGLITQPAVSQKMKRLERCGIISAVITDFKGRCFVRFNWDKVYESLAPKKYVEQQKYKYCCNWYEKIFQYIYEEEQLERQWKEEWDKKSLHERVDFYRDQEKEFEKEYEQYKQQMNEGDNMGGLLDDEDMNKTVYYCKPADKIAKRILIKYPHVFVTKYPKENEEPTKTYIKLCRKIEDIYNGRFISSRFYSFDENVFNNKQFVTEGWKEKIKEVKGDWGKVKTLIFNAVENFVLMNDENRMPMKKDYLTNNLNDWFFSDNPNSKGQSQFIQSLNEPQIIKQKLGEDKAKKIIEDLKSKSPVSYYAGHELNSLLPPKASELNAWENIQKIIKWGKLLWQFEPNAKYFLECKIKNNLECGPKVLPALFARYLKENEIDVTLGTLDIEQGADNNAPWAWFIKDACKKHQMNSNYLYCFDSQDFLDAHNDMNKITFDDMENVIF